MNGIEKVAWRDKLTGLWVRRALQYLSLLLVLLLLLRIALPYGVEWYVNRKLDESPKYEGHIGDVDMHLYRGAYSIDDVTITKVEGEVPVPLFSAEHVEFSLLWSALLHGSLVSSIVFEKPNINIVDSNKRENKQTGSDRRWFALLDDLAPLRIDEVQVHEGSVHFRNYDVARDVDVYVTQLEATASNLTNSKDLAQTMVGHISGQGRMADAGRVEFNVDYDPDSEFPTFNFAGRVSDIPLIVLDDLITAYAPFDVEAGNLSITAELAAKEGALTGYVKPLITGLKIFRWHGDVVEDRDNPFRLAWEALVGLVSEILENQPHDQLATVVELNGRFDAPKADNWHTFVSILRNAFIKALGPEFEHRLNDDQAQGADASANTQNTPGTSGRNNEPSSATRSK